MDIEPISEYVAGEAGGRQYSAELRHLPGGPWYIEVIHVEALAPLKGSDKTWPSREEAAQAAHQLVAALSQ
jgi:hypothetical protein